MGALTLLDMAFLIFLSLATCEAARRLSITYPHSRTHDALEVSWRFRIRANTNPNGTEANAAGRSVRACVARESKT
jgi:hypothetical protein